MLETILLILGCLFIGWILRGMFDSLWRSDRPIGTLRVDQTDPDGPYLFLELEDSDWRTKIVKKEEVTFKVNIRK